MPGTTIDPPLYTRQVGIVRLTANERATIYYTVDGTEPTLESAHEDDQVVAQYGANGYRQLQLKALTSVAISGPNRIAKVLPVTPHDPALAPDLQYPMGGGGLQWTIDRAHKKNFLIALHVDPSGVADAGSFTVSLADGQPFQQLYDARARVARHLAAA